MKKTLFVAALAALLVFAFATSAFAYGWEAWNAGYNTGIGALGTPHKDYRLQTVKCGVCHAAHNTNTAVDSELLLRSDIANACTYCHIDTANGGKQIYNADPVAYDNNAAFDINDYAHNAVYGYSCSSCHSVHGANTYNGGTPAIASVSEKILRQYPAGDEHEQQAGLPANWSDGTDRNRAVSAFCTQCHGYYANDSQTAVEFHGATTTTGYTHPMKSADAVFSPALGAGSTVAYSGRVAWVASDSCRACHDAGTDGSTNNLGVILSSFPHYTPGAQQFTQAALYDGAAKSDAANADFDGVCLKCHKGSATTGVGFDF